MALKMKLLLSILILTLLSVRSHAATYANEFTTNATPTGGSTLRMVPYLYSDTRTNSTLSTLIGAAGFSGTTNFHNFYFIDEPETMINITNAVSQRVALAFTNITGFGANISNNSSGFAESVTLGNSAVFSSSGLPLNISLTKYKINSPATSAYFKGSQEQRWNGEFINCDFNAGNFAFGSWYGNVYMSGCTLSTSNLLASQAAVADYSVCFEGNDYTTSIIENSFLNYGGSTAESVGLLLFLGSQTTLNNCRFNSISSGGTIRSAIALFENRATVTANSCVFNLNGGMLLVQDANNIAPETDYVVFNNCYIDPPTNGVVIISSNNATFIPMVVIGGNIGPQHFDYTNSVRFISAPKFPIPNLDWTTLTTSAFTNGLAARLPVYTNSGTIYYLNLWTNTP